MFFFFHHLFYTMCYDFPSLIVFPFPFIFASSRLAISKFLFADYTIDIIYSCVCVCVLVYEYFSHSFNQTKHKKYSKKIQVVYRTLDDLFRIVYCDCDGTYNVSTTTWFESTKKLFNAVWSQYFIPDAACTRKSDIGLYFKHSFEHRVYFVRC